MASTLFSPGTVYTSAWGNETDKATHNYLSAVAGTNTITATGPVSSVGYVAGDRYFFVPANANSGAVTININGLGAKNVTKYGVSALVANDLITAEVFEVVYDGVQFQLLNPKTVDVAVTGRLIGTQTFTASGTYTPTSGTTSVIIEVIGGGGGGAGSPATAAGQFSVGGGGGSGAFTKTRLTSGFSGATVTVGVAGTAGTTGAVGGSGGASSFGASVTAPGGGGGNPSAAAAVVVAAGGNSGPAGIGGSILQSPGTGASIIYARFADGSLAGGNGAASFFSGGGVGPFTTTNVAGNSPPVGAKGSGGSGSATGASQGGAPGAPGVAGLVIVYEYS